MAIPNAKYWADRMQNLEAALLDQGMGYAQNLEAQFDRAIASIEKDIAVWYQRFADNNAISYTEARKWLTGAQLDEFRWTVQEYIKHGEENALSGQWIKELENASAKLHISRLDALKLQLQQQAEVLHGNQLDGLDNLLRRTYTEGYYARAYEIQRGIGTGWTMHSLNESAISKVLARPWATDMQTFRDRAWTNKQALVGSVNQHLTQMIIRGGSAHSAITAIAKDMGVAKSKAARLVMTESAAFSAASQKDCYNELGIEKYTVVVSFDEHTCEKCGPMDGVVFKMSEYAAGLTANPFHPWCRCCTAPYFEDMAHLGERARRDPDTGETVTDVPRSMKYGEWKEKFLDEKGDKIRILGNGASGNNEKYARVMPDDNKTENADGLLGRIKKIFGSNKAENEILNEFDEGLKNLSNAYAQRVLRQARKEAKIDFSSSKNGSYHSRGKVTLGKAATPSTIAHELFHYIDFKNDVSSRASFKNAVANDYKRILSKKNGVYNSIKDMLYSKYPDAFARKGTFIKFKEEYRGMSDIFSGLTKDTEIFGYGHDANYWNKPGNIEKEIWAQFGRFYYDNNPDVMDMAKELFGNTFNEVESLLKELK